MLFCVLQAFWQLFLVFNRQIIKPHNGVAIFEKVQMQCLYLIIPQLIFAVVIVIHNKIAAADFSQLFISPLCQWENHTVILLEHPHAVQ